MKKKIISICMFLVPVVLTWLFIDNPYIGPLGSHILDFLGIVSLESKDSGFYTFIIFSSLATCSIVLVRIYDVGAFNIPEWLVVILFFVSVHFLVTITHTYLEYDKSNKSGIEALSFDRRESFLSFHYKDGRMIELRVSISLANHSEDPVEFYMMIDDVFTLEELDFCIEIYDLEGDYFTINPNESAKFNVNLDKDSLGKDDLNIVGENVSGRTQFNSIIIGDKEGKRIRYTQDDLTGDILEGY